MAGMSSIAVAQTPAGEADYSTGKTPITLSAGAAHWYFSSDRDLQNMNSPWVGLEWAWTDQWSTELSFTQDDANNEAFPGTKTEVTLANLGMKYYGGSFIGDGGTLRPYAVLGAGFFSTDPKRTGGESNDDTTVNAGLGVRWMITQRFGASLDGRSVYNIDKGNADTIAYLGLNYYLGNVAPPPVIDHEVCLDEDGDGVCDQDDACLGTPPTPAWIHRVARCRLPRWPRSSSRSTLPSIPLWCRSSTSPTWVNWPSSSSVLTRWM